MHKLSWNGLEVTYSYEETPDERWGYSGATPGGTDFRIESARVDDAEEFEAWLAEEYEPEHAADILRMSPPERRAWLEGHFEESIFGAARSEAGRGA